MKKKTLFFHLPVHPWIWILLLAALLPKSAYSIFTSRTLPTQSQLPVATIHCIFQDSEGFMWYGMTGGGLCRDNGYQVDIFRPKGRAMFFLANNNVNCITEDNLGRIWFGTEKGLYRINKNTFSLTEILTSRNMGITALYQDSKHHIWVASSKGVYCIDPTHDRILIHDKNQAISSASQITEDHLNRIWIATRDGGPYIYLKEKKKFKKAPWSITSGAIRMIEDKQQSGFWIATWGDGIVFYDTNSGEITRNPQTAVTQDISCCIDMLIDKTQGLVWVTTMNNLYLYQREGKKLIPLNTDEFLSPGYKILDGLCEDRFGNIWVAGFTPHTFIVSYSAQSIIRETVPAMNQLTGFPLLPDRMVADGHGFWIWQGRMGLMYYDPRISHLYEAGGMQFYRCICKTKGKEGIWAAAGRVLKHLQAEDNKITEKLITTFTTPIQTIADNGNGTLFIGTQDALYSYSLMGNTLNRLSKSSSRIENIAADSEGNVYFTNQLNQLFLCEVNGQKRLISQLSKETITALALASDGTLWYATQQGSVYQWNAVKKQLHYEQQMSNANGDAIIDIKTDRSGHVWLLSNQYLREYNPRNHSFRTLRNTDSDINVSYFYHLEEVDDNQIGVDGAGAYLQVKSSKMLDQQNAEGSQPYITAIQMGDSTHLLGKSNGEVQIPAQISSVILRCSTFDPIHAQKVTFAYKIEGWNKEWIYLPQGVNSIYLTHLPTGKYKLAIKATDRYGCWSEHETMYIVHRLPAWWQTWWAYSIYGLGIILLGYGIWNLNRRIRILRILQQRRNMLKLTEVQLSDEESNKDTARSDEFLKLVISKIEEHLADTSYNVEQLSCDMCMSRMSLYRKMQTASGLSPNEFIKDVRLKKAAALLKRYPNITIGQLAAKVGFATPKYLSKCFKTKFGVLPSQYTQNRAPD